MNKRITAFILAITMAIPAVAFASDDELVEVAANQEAVATSEKSSAFGADKANDGINDNADYTAWVSAADDSRPAWQGDMAMGYKITSVEIEARKGSDAEERKNFRVLVSNDPDFTEYEIVGECKADYGKDGVWSVKFESKNRYQFIKVEKTSDGALSIGEIRVFTPSSSILYGTEVNERNTQQPLTDDEGRYILPADVKDTEIEDEVRFLSALNIMRGYPDGKFLPDDYITRAEFATVAVKLTGSNLHVSQNTFSDVASDYWAYDAIETCYENGMIKGVEEGIFSPEEYITYEQAIKIVVCALGYETLAQKKGGYPGGYTSIAAQLGILDGVRNDDGNITRGDIAKLVYQSLFARLMTSDYVQDDIEILGSGKDETILSKVFGLAKTEGLITEIPGLSLTNESLNERAYDYLVINDMLMTTKDPYYRDYFGHIAEVYYREVDKGGDLEAVVMLLSDKGTELIIDAEDAISFDTSNVLEFYDENDRVKSIDFITALDVIYNNKALVSYEHETLLPDTGEIRAIDYDGDGNYDIMIIRAVKTYVIDWVNPDERIIYPKVKTGTVPSPVEYDETDDIVKLYNIEGEEIEFSALKEWNVLSVETSANSSGDRVTNIYVSDVFARGDISSVDEEYVTIRNKTYEVAEIVNISDLRPGDKGMFYLDYYGRIAAFDGDKYDEGKYGFITKILFDEELEKPGFRIFTTTGAFKDFAASEYLRIDGTSCETRDEVIQALVRNGGTAGEPQQLVRYTANNKNEITIIDTTYVGEGETDENLTRDFDAADRYYKGEDGTFGMILTLADDAVVMNIPEDLGREDEYSIGASFAWDTDNSFEAYDCGSLNDAKVALVRAESDAAIVNTAPFFLVDKINKGLNKYEEPANILSGWYKGEYVSYPEQEAGIIEAADLKRGDIIAVLISSNNEIKQIEKRFYNGSRPEDAPANSISVDTPMGPGGGYTPYWNLFLVYGTVVAKNSRYMKVRVDTSGTAAGYTLPQPNYETIIVNLNNSQLRKYIFDSEEDEVRLAEGVDFVDEESAGTGSTVVLKAGSGRVSDIVILK